MSQSSKRLVQPKWDPTLEDVHKEENIELEPKPVLTIFEEDEVLSKCDPEQAFSGLI